MWLISQAIQAAIDTGASTGIDPLTALTQLGIGALIAAPFAYMWRSVRADLAAKDVECRELHNTMFTRERDLNDNTLPRLADAITTLRDTQRGMGVANQMPDYVEVTRRLEAAVDRLGDYRRR